MRICKIGLSIDARFKVCNKADEGLLHLFFYCSKLNDFISKMREIIIALMEGGRDYIKTQEDWEMLFLFGRKEYCEI